MLIIADRRNGQLIVNDTCYTITNEVRTLAAGTRQSHEVVRSIPDDLPYDPEKFPKGRWKITALEWQKSKGFDYNTYGPVKIRTDAWQWVNTWELDDEGDYYKETDRLVKDTCYHLHYSKSSTTYGCIRIGTAANAEIIAKAIQLCWDKGETVELEVL